MDNQNKRVFILVIVLLILFVSWSGWHYILNTATDSRNLEKTLSFNVMFANKEHRVVNAWYNESNRRWYLFLPASARQVNAINSDYSIVKTKYINVDEIGDSTIIPFTVEVGKKLISDSLTILKSKNIPSLFITTKSNSMDFIHLRKGNKEQGSMSLLSFSDSISDLSNISVEISGRGNTSWDAEKKGYIVKSETPVDLLKTGSAKDWILVANAHTNLLSNTLAFELEKLMGCSNSVSSEHVDLYLNGEYRGNYILCERIQIGRQGIDVQNLDSINLCNNPSLLVNEFNKYHSKDKTRKGYHLEKETEDWTGGFLIERDVPEYWESERSGFITESGDHYVVHSPRYCSKKQVQYIQSFLNNLQTAVSSNNGYNGDGMHYSTYLDEESFVKKYLIDEFLAYRDAGRSSAYYYKNSDRIDSRLYAGPGWDYEGAFLRDFNEITFSNTTGYSTSLFELLNDHTDFRNKVQEYYKDVMIGAVDSLLITRFKYYEDLIEASAKMDEIRWNRENFLQSCNNIYSWIQNRKRCMTSFINSDKVKIKIVFTDLDRKAYLFKNIGDTISEAEVLKYLGDYRPSSEEFYIANSSSVVSFPIIVSGPLELHQSSVPSSMTFIGRISNMIRQAVPEFCFGIFCALVFFLYLYERRKK